VRLDAAREAIAAGTRAWPEKRRHCEERQHNHTHPQLSTHAQEYCSAAPHSASTTRSPPPTPAVLRDARPISGQSCRRLGEAGAGLPRRSEPQCLGGGAVGVLGLVRGSGRRWGPGLVRVGRGGRGVVLLVLLVLVAPVSVSASDLEP
jgi:hypothetical protein